PRLQRPATADPVLRRCLRRDPGGVQPARFGRSRHDAGADHEPPRGGSERGCVVVSTVTDPGAEPREAKGAEPNLSDRARTEQRLGWKLAMPAFVVMLLVTAYPILQAIWNSFFYYRLTDPDNREFVGLQNYIVSFSDSVFWKAMAMTVLVTVITVVVELVLGFIIALVMHRIVIPRRTLRT